MRNPMPIFALVAVALFIVLGIIAFGASMESVDLETNSTATGPTLQAYQISYGWWLGIGLLMLILALGFAFWYFFG